MKACSIEWNLIKKNILPVVYLTIVTAIITIRAKSLLITAVTASLIIATKLISLPFEVEETESLTRFYKSLPIPYEDFVFSRYAILLVIGLVSIIFAVIINFILQSFIGWSDLNIKQILVSILIGLIIFLLTLVFEVPLFYKHGAIKAKFISVLPALIFLGLFLIFNRINISAPVLNLLLDNSGTVLIILVIVTAIVGVFSYKISTDIYKSKE